MTTLQQSEPPEAVPAGQALGRRLRELRRSRRRTLRSVAEAAEVSESFLSQVERGRANPSVSSLTRIAAALGLTVHELFAPSRQDGSQVVRAGETAPLEFGEGARKWLLSPRPLQDLEVVVCEYDVGAVVGLFADRVGVVLLCLICGVSTVVQGFAGRYLRGDPRARRFHAVAALMTAATAATAIAARLATFSEALLAIVRRRLAAGDAASYRSSQPHRTVNLGDVPARVLYALTPPTF